MRNPEFGLSAAAFVSLVGGITVDQWERPGLGEWSVLDLVGHASRSLTTVESYLADPPEPGAELVDDPVAYIRAVQVALKGGAADSAAIAQRGRDAGAALGPEPALAVRALADRVVALVEATPGDAAVKTIFGPMTLRGYLPTRTFELAVHTLDLADALGVEPPAGLEAPLAASLGLASAVVCQAGAAAVVLRALTGRGVLPTGFSVV